jgi:hypothetical protein
VDSAVHVHAEVLLRLDRVRKAALKLLELVRRLLRAILVVDNLQSASLLHRAVRGGAVRAIDNLPARRIHGLAQALPLQILKPRAPEALQICAPVGLVKEDPCTSL